MFLSVPRALRTLAGLLLLVGPALAVAAAPAPAATQARRIIVFVWDGMRPDAISAEDTPNLLALGARGSVFDDNHATYPTFTMANASSFATGAFPGALGFYGNHLWAPGTQGADAKGQAVDFHSPVFTEDYAILRDLDARENHELLQLPTLFATARKAGLKTALVGKSGPAFLQDYTLANGDTSGRAILLDENTALPLAFARELRKAGFALPKNAANTYDPRQLARSEENDSPTEQGKMLTLKDGASSDATAAADTTPAAANAWMMKVYLEHVLPQHRPDLSIVWLRNPDTTEHQYGVGSPEFHLALKAQDALLGQLEDTLKTLGLDQSTDIIVVSDHGHSNIAGPRDLFPLRQINDGRVAGVDVDWGYSVSGGVRLADELAHGGITAFDGTGCIYAPVMSGIKPDGTALLPTRYDDDGRICGKPGPYTTPSYKLPDAVPKGALVIASNGGTEYLYQPEHDAALVKRTVRFLQSRQYVAAVFVARRYGKIPGTLPAENVHLENAKRGPDIIISYAWDADAKIQGFAGTEYAGQSNERGEHGSFSPIDVHNTLLAAGPDFRRAFHNPLPSGNVDLAPTVAALMGLKLPRAQGRVLHESLTGALAKPVASYTVTPTTAQPESPATGLRMQRVDGAPLDGTRFSFMLRMKQLQNDGKSWTYFDQASPDIR